MGALNPCPFCGSEARLKEYKPTVSGVAICTECGARSPICRGDHTGGWKAHAIEAWNRRAERTCRNEYHGIGRTGLPIDGPFLCSACGYRADVCEIDAGGGMLTVPDFCPNCGAKVVDA